MATTYGLSATGFVIKTLAQIQLELQQAFQATFGAGLDVTGNSVLGQIIGIMSAREAEIWELAQAVYLSAFPDTAQGVDLSYAVTLTGQQRLQGTASTVVAQFTGKPGTLIPAGFQAAVVGSGTIFVTTADITLDPVYGTASTTMISQQLGPIAAPLGTLTVINTP
ncbi:MAG: baseplate J/gp47 family protein, partial [Cyanobacteria bacterium REEB65]|nr:baseplate J/gp47 family protein [Cyanobacteria bacterium REEB65]